MTTYYIWEDWPNKKSESSNVTDVLKKAYVLAKQPKYKSAFVNIGRTGRKVDPNWKLVAYMTMADKKKVVVIMDVDFTRSRVLKANGELGEIVRNKSIIRDGKKIGDLTYIGQQPEKGVYWDYYTNKHEIYVKKRK